MKVTFKDLGLSATTLAILEKKGFVNPTDIQGLVIPHLLQGKQDIIGKAQTGTGKTAAFGLPIIEMLDEQKKAPQALILAPTRELAIQVAKELDSLRGDRRISICTIYGGQSIVVQLKELKKNPQIIVGTPGRVIDHLERKSLKLNELSFFVLDEADEMLNFGFLPDISSILEYASDNPRKLFFSATMPQEILKLARNYMTDPLIVQATNHEQTGSRTEQWYCEVPSMHKKEALCRLLSATNDFYGFIFCKTKHDVDIITKLLQDKQFNAQGIHGDFSQAQRERTLTSFREKRCTILVGTDVAARGIDVKGITHVINYSLPQSPDAYTHRIGRTGRAGESGIAYSIITPAEYSQLQFIKRKTNTNIQRANIPTEVDIQQRKKELLKKNITQLLESKKNISAHVPFVHELFELYDPVQLVAALVHEELGHSGQEDNIFAVKDRPERSERDDRGSSDRGGRSRGGDRGGRGGDRGGRSRGGDRGGRGGGSSDRGASRGNDRGDRGDRSSDRSDRGSRSEGRDGARSERSYAGSRSGSDERKPRERSGSSDRSFNKSRPAKKSNKTY